MTPPGRSARGVLIVIGVVGSMLWWTTAPTAPQPRRVVVVGDSIILGAQGPMVAGFRGRGWDVTFDAVESRSTAAAVGALEVHRPLLTDSLVLSFGANDAGNPAVFRQRVDELLDAAGGVPNVYWLTIREVRDYYAPANQILRDAAAVRPNVTVLDWHAATFADTGATARDGLHLSGSGAALMSDLVLDAVVNGQVGPAVPSSPADAPVTPPVEPTAAPLELPAPLPAPQPATAPPMSVGTIASPTTTTANATPTTSTPIRPSTRSRQADRVDQQGGGAGLLDSVDTVGTTLGSGLALFVILLALAGALLAGWSLVGARPGRPVRVPAPDRPAVRAEHLSPISASDTHKS